MPFTSSPSVSPILSPANCFSGFVRSATRSTARGKLASMSPRIGARAAKLHAILQQAERCLDDGLGQCYLQDARIAKIVAEAIQHCHQRRYLLRAWCFMPNHVHVLFSLLRENKLEEILHTWKSYSAHQANKLLGRTGHFWQREYFDRLARNEFSLLKITEYIGQNPPKAGLQNWPWFEILPHPPSPAGARALESFILYRPEAR